VNAAGDFTLPDAPPDPPREDDGTGIEFEKGLPAAIDAERTIIGAAFLDNAAYSEAAETLEPSDFALTAHQRIFSCMGDLIDASVAADFVTVSQELARRKEIESIGGVAYLASLTEGLPRRLSIKDYIAAIKDKSRLRQLINICSTAITRAADQSEATQPILESVEAELLEIAQDTQAGRLQSVADSVRAAGGPDHYVRAITDPEQKPGLPTGFTDYDRMTGGLQKRELTVVAARPSMGKSALAMNIAANVGRDGEMVVAVFSIEMSRQALERRWIASEALIDVRRVMTGEFLRSDQKEKIAGALFAIAGTRVFIDDSAVLTPTQMRAKCRRLKQREGRLDLTIIDYLQLLSSGQKYGNRREEVDAISRALKQCAKELDCPVLALAQINRKAEERTDKRPMLSDLRESGQIEQDADVVAFLHRPDYYHRDDGEQDNLAELLIAKQRNGATGIVKLAWIPSVTRFGNLAYGG
jgi:replicative DNA helicase